MESIEKPEIQDIPEVPEPEIEPEKPKKRNTRAANAAKARKAKEMKKIRDELKAEMEAEQAAKEHVQDDSSKKNLYLALGLTGLVGGLVLSLCMKSKTPVEVPQKKEPEPIEKYVQEYIPVEQQIPPSQPPYTKTDPMQDYINSFQ